VTRLCHSTAAAAAALASIKEPAVAENGDQTPQFTVEKNVRAQKKTSKLTYD